jgi:hypothetical protein
VNSLALRIVAVLVGVAVVAVALALCINKFLREPEPVAAPPTAPGRAEITLGTTPAVGSLGGHPTWVSYLARCGGGWDHTTTYKLPANSRVDVTIYQFDSATGLRNPFFSQVQGTVGGEMRVDGRTVRSINPADASHTFTVPDLGVVVPLPGVPPTPPTSAQRCRARSATPAARSSSRSALPGPATIAGSASSLALRGSTTATGGPCRRSATWTASSR